MSWLLAAALLLVQTMGLMHGVLLGPKSAGSDRAQVSMQRAQQPVADAYGAAGQWVNAVISSHRGDNDCRLFDQASHGSLAPKLTALPPPVVLPSFAVVIVPSFAGRTVTGSAFSTTAVRCWTCPTLATEWMTIKFCRHQATASHPRIQQSPWPSLRTLRKSYCRKLAITATNAPPLWPVFCPSNTPRRCTRVRPCNWDRVSAQYRVLKGIGKVGR